MMYMIEENSLNDDLESIASEDEGTSFSSTTYTTLTTLQPLSSVIPEKLDKPNPPYGYPSEANAVYCELNRKTELNRVDSSYSSDYDSLVGCYEGLEPLHPSVYIDNEGNTIQCETASSLSSSYFIPSAYLSPELAAFSNWSGLSFRSSGDLIGYRNSRCSFDSVISSRASSPDTTQYHPPPGGNPHCASHCANPHLALALTTVLTLDDFEAFMNSEIVETRELSELISSELRRCNVPQALFAHRVLGRSQGTLSDLLRNPKPWSKLKTGRETYGKMWQWLLETDTQRLLPFQNCGYKFDFKPSDYPSSNTVGSQVDDLDPSSARTSKTKAGQSPVSMEKKPRILFTEAQRQTLKAMFEKEQRPTKEAVIELSDALCLPFTTVSNFFMNARRRSRNKLLAAVAKSEAVESSEAERSQLNAKEPAEFNSEIVSQVDEDDV